MKKLNGFVGENLLMEIATGGTLLTDRTRNWVPHTANIIKMGMFDQRPERDKYLLQMYTSLGETLAQEPWMRQTSIKDFTKIVEALQREIVNKAYLSLEANGIPYTT